MEKLVIGGKNVELIISPNTVDFEDWTNNDLDKLEMGVEFFSFYLNALPSDGKNERVTNWFYIIEHGLKCRIWADRKSDDHTIHVDAYKYREDEQIQYK